VGFLSGHPQRPFLGASSAALLSSLLLRSTVSSPPYHRRLRFCRSRRRQPPSWRPSISRPASSPASALRASAAPDRPLYRPLPFFCSVASAFERRLFSRHPALLLPVCFLARRTPAHAARFQQHPFRRRGPAPLPFSCFLLPPCFTLLALLLVLPPAAARSSAASPAPTLPPMHHPPSVAADTLGVSTLEHAVASLSAWACSNFRRAVKEPRHHYSIPSPTPKIARQASRTYWRAINPPGAAAR